MLLQCDSAGAKFHPSPHLKLSHRGGCRELAQDPCMQTPVWMGLVSGTHVPTSCFPTAIKQQRQKEKKTRYLKMWKKTLWWRATRCYQISCVGNFQRANGGSDRESALFDNWMWVEICWTCKRLTASLSVNHLSQEKTTTKTTTTTSPRLF